MDNTGGLKLGNIELDVPFFQASLSGYSDYAMRSLARRFGCPFTMADMMLAKSAANPRVLRKPFFRPGDDEHPIGAQIIGTIPDTMAKAARDLAAIGYDLIDLNFGAAWQGIKSGHQPQQETNSEIHAEMKDADQKIQPQKQVGRDRTDYEHRRDAQHQCHGSVIIDDGQIGKVE